MAMNTSDTQKPIHSIVLDAGPIIKNDPSVSTLLKQAEELYTIPAVLDEIRDPTTRARVETTLKPFIKCRSPTPASIKIITDFARRTGDLEVLSKPDVHLMALAYELECERNHGDWRLRSVPGQKRLNGTPPAPAPVEESVPQLQEETSTKGIEEQLAASHISPGAEQQVAADVPTEEQPSIHLPQADESNSPPSLVDEIQTSDSDDTDSEGWITPKNIKKYQEKNANGLTGAVEEVKTIQVAVITSDFAMQNVLLRMNLNLCSSTLQRIRQLKTWVLRCHACFYITRDMGKQFCSRCGKPTLLRTSCSTDKDGNFKVHLKKNMQWNKRGNVYSIPKPVAGTSNGKKISGGGKGGWGQDLILAEDQKEYVAAMTSARRKKDKDLMDEDYLPSILSGDRGRAGGRPKVGAGRNVNSKKRK